MLLGCFDFLSPKDAQPKATEWNGASEGNLLCAIGRNEHLSSLEPVRRLSNDRGAGIARW